MGWGVRSNYKSPFKCTDRPTQNPSSGSATVYVFQHWSQTTQKFKTHILISLLAYICFCFDVKKSRLKNVRYFTLWLFYKYSYYVFNMTFRPLDLYNYYIQINHSLLRKNTTCNIKVEYVHGRFPVFPFVKFEILRKCMVNQEKQFSFD